MIDKRLPDMATVPGLDQLPAPVYVYDLDRVRDAYAQLRHALPEPSIIFYSVKANPHPAVVHALSELGCWAEISSEGELGVSLQAGLDPENLLYTGPGKREAEVRAALAAGVRRFSVDSPSAIRQVRDAADSMAVSVDCLLRVNSSAPTQGAGLRMTGQASPFGADADWVRAEPAEFRVGLSGLHFYPASNLADEPSLLAQLDRSLSTARQLADTCALQLDLLDLGGGFGAPFARRGPLPRLDNLGEQLEPMLTASFPGWRDGRPRIAFESGRYLTATCGSLVTRVADVKRSHGRPVVVLESGINHLGGMSGLRRLPPVVPDLVLPKRTAAPEQAGALHDAIIAGPLCTPLDCWSRSADLPHLRPGDLVVVPNVGAYGLSASLVAFLGHPPPDEAIVDQGAIVEVSRLSVERIWTSPRPQYGRR